MYDSNGKRNFKFCPVHHKQIFLFIYFIYEPAEPYDEILSAEPYDETLSNLFHPRRGNIDQLIIYVIFTVKTVFEINKRTTIYSR